MSPSEPNHHRRSIRLKGYDYALPGAYFVTICCANRACLFGEVVDGEMILNPEGQVARREWQRLARRFPLADFFDFVVMPNHVHGIIVIRDVISHTGAEQAQAPGLPQFTPAPGEHNGAPGTGMQEDLNPTHRLGSPLRLDNRPNVAAGSLGAIVRAYKSASAYRIHAQRGASRSAVWQRNYYEHIIRNEADWRRIAAYIQANPLGWTEDQLHPAAPPNCFQ